MSFSEKLREKLMSLFNMFFKKKKVFKLGIYGPTNVGKTTLANSISMDWLGEEVGSVSRIPHETREIQQKESVVITSGRKKLMINLIDTPGIETKVDFIDFKKYGIKGRKAKKRAKEATKGIIEAIRWLDNMDIVVVVMDATKNPYTQVNLTLIGNLEARNIPVLIAANKIDLKKANLKKIKSAFPNYDVVGISAKQGKNMSSLYKTIFKIAKK